MASPVAGGAEVGTKALLSVGCSGDHIASAGNAVEPNSGRRFALDYPCTLKRGEKVTVVLALHGGGLSGDWMRRYFPIKDLKERYRLVVVTPTGTGNGWVPTLDDKYLRDIVEEVEESVDKRNIKAFWLVGHSLGGQTANRLIASDPFFTRRLTGWVSLSGGRLGSKREEVRAAIPPGSSGLPPPGQAMSMTADASILPERPFSFIYETGEHELTAAGLPETSKWAAKLGCRARAEPMSVVDISAGQVYDDRPQSKHNLIWGREPRPGSALLYLYPGCADGRIVADVVRLDKGHTEGLEPRITEEIVRLITQRR